MNNNQVTVTDRNGQSMLVELLTYFKNKKNNKNYIIYTKNEVVQDGLVKLYIAEEDNGMLGDISIDEWNDLKLIMRDIIKGAMNNG